MPDLEPTLLPALAAMRQGSTSRLTAKDAGRLIALQKKLTTAIGECEERKGQIAPLLDSLARTREKTPDA